MSAASARRAAPAPCPGGGRGAGLNPEVSEGGAATGGPCKRRTTRRLRKTPRAPARWAKPGRVDPPALLPAQAGAQSTRAGPPYPRACSLRRPGRAQLGPGWPRPHPSCSNIQRHAALLHHRRLGMHVQRRVRHRRRHRLLRLTLHHRVDGSAIGHGPTPPLRVVLPFELRRPADLARIDDRLNALRHRRLRTLRVVSQGRAGPRPYSVVGPGRGQAGPGCPRPPLRPGRGQAGPACPRPPPFLVRPRNSPEVYATSLRLAVEVQLRLFDPRVALLWGPCRCCGCAGVARCVCRNIRKDPRIDLRVYKT